MAARLAALLIGTLLAACGASSGVSSVGSGGGVPGLEQSHYLAEIKQALRAQWPQNRTVTVVCHGHSVTAGYFKTPRTRSLDAYPNLLRIALAEHYPYAVINIIVSGIGGENAETGAERFTRDVLAHRPDVVTLDYALNDRAIGLDRARAAWMAMIEAAQARQIKVILLTPTPDLNANLDDPNDPLNQHAAQIRQLAARYHVGLVDSLEIFQRAAADGGLPRFMAQFNHPNRAGHRLIAEALYRWFE
jgi:acyl-CoA thioesterase I